MLSCFNSFILYGVCNVVGKIFASSTMLVVVDLLCFVCFIADVSCLKSGENGQSQSWQAQVQRALVTKDETLDLLFSRVGVQVDLCC
jgi:hypothetical protein